MEQKQIIQKLVKQFGNIIHLQTQYEGFQHILYKCICVITKTKYERQTLLFYRHWNQLHSEHPAIGQVFSYNIKRIKTKIE
jgi:hypothetical protein